MQRNLLLTHFIATISLVLHYVAHEILPAVMSVKNSLCKAIVSVEQIQSKLHKLIKTCNNLESENLQKAFTEKVKATQAIMEEMLLELHGEKQWSAEYLQQLLKDLDSIKSDIEKAKIVLLFVQLQLVEEKLKSLEKKLLTL